jgi:hypothetical protein
VVAVVVEEAAAVADGTDAPLEELGHEEKADEESRILEEMASVWLLASGRLSEKGT